MKIIKNIIGVGYVLCVGSALSQVMSDSTGGAILTSPPPSAASTNTVDLQSGGVFSGALRMPMDTITLKKGNNKCAILTYDIKYPQSFGMHNDIMLRSRPCINSRCYAVKWENNWSLADLRWTLNGSPIGNGVLMRTQSQPDDDSGGYVINHSVVSNGVSGKREICESNAQLTWAAPEICTYRFSELKYCTFGSPFAHILMSLKDK